MEVLNGNILELNGGCLMGKSSANEGFCWKIIELNAGIVIAMFDCESVSRVDIRYCQVLMFSGFECCWAS